MSRPRAALMLLAATLALLLPVTADAATFDRCVRWPTPLWDLSTPVDVAPDATAGIWVSDEGHSRIVRMSPEGTELFAIGWRGVQADSFPGANGIDLAPDGSLWASSGGRVVHLSTSGELLGTITLPASNGYGPSPAGLDVGGDGKIYVADPGVQAVYVYSESGEMLHKIGTGDGFWRSTPGDFADVRDVCVDEYGNVWTAERDSSRIQKFDSNGTFLLAFTPKDGSGSSFGPLGIAAVPGGGVVVSGAGGLYRYDASGSFQTTLFSGGGSGGGINTGPDGTIYWADGWKNAVRKIDAGGTVTSYERAQYYKELFNAPQALAVAGDGRVAVAQANWSGGADRKVRIFSPSGSVVTTITLPATDNWSPDEGLTFDKVGNLWICDNRTGAVFKYGPSGSLLYTLGAISLPTSLAFGPSGDFFVASQFMTVKHFGPTGASLGSWSAAFSSVVNYTYTQRLAIDQYGEIFATQQKTSQSSPGILRLGLNGEVTGYTFAYGSNPGEFGVDLEQIALDGKGRLWVCDTSNKRLQVLDRDGNFLDAWGGPPDEPFLRPDGIAFDAQGKLWVADRDRNTVSAYTVSDLAEPKPVPSLSLTAPATSAYADVTMTGSLTSSGTALPGRSVVIEYSYNNRVWLPARTVVTTTGGAFSVRLAPTKAIYYRARFAGDAAAGSRLSPVRRVLPRVLLSVPSAPTSTTRGKGFVSAGTIKPCHTTGTYPVKLQFYRYESGKWVLRKTVGAKVSNSSSYPSYSKYSASLSLSLAGKWRVRAYHAADKLNAATYTSYRSLVVR